MNRSVLNDQTLNGVSCCVNTLSHFCVTSFIYPLFLGWISLASRTTTAHGRAQRGRSTTAAVRLRLPSSARIRPATTAARLRLRHVNTQQLPHHQHPPHLSPPLRVPHQLPMVLYSQQGPQQAAHSDSDSFFIILSSRENI